MPDKQYSKLEEEIIQILDRMETPEGERRPRQVPRPIRPPKRRFRPNLKLGNTFSRSPWIFLALAFGLAFAALALRDTSGALATLLGIASLAAFFAPIVMRRNRPSAMGGAPQRYGTKMWRGRDITIEPPRGDSPVLRARRWFGNRRNRPPF